MIVTLYEKYKNKDPLSSNIDRINPEEIIDSLYCLCNSVESEKLVQAAPESIEINEDGSVTLLDGSDLNIYYAAPEVILGKTGADKRSAWYTLGLLCYFLINGRSFYEDKSINLVSLKEICDRGVGLISADGIDPSAEDALSLLKLAMEKLTSWNPKTRSGGVKYLLKAVGQYDSVAMIDYVFNGQVIKSDRRVIEGSCLNCVANTKIKGDDDKIYTLSDTTKIHFRPGTRHYSMNVSAFENTASNEPYERFLCVQIRQQTAKIKLMKLGPANQTRKIEVDRSADRRYMFWLLTGDPVRKKTVSEEFKYYVNVPADPAGGSSLLQIDYNPDSGFDVALYNKAGNTRISDNIMHFEI